MSMFSNSIVLQFCDLMQQSWGKQMCTLATVELGFWSNSRVPVYMYIIIYDEYLFHGSAVNLDFAKISSVMCRGDNVHETLVKSVVLLCRE